MNHYPHHIGDFNNATRHLTFVERALYRELLDLYYDTEAPLPRDFDRLARRVLAVSDELRQALQVLLDEFFVLSEEGWRNARCDIEIAAYLQKQEQQSRAGKASAAKRKGKPAPGVGNVPTPGTGDKPAAAANEAGITGATGVERTLNERTTNQNQNQNHIDEDGQARAAADVPASEADWAMTFGEFGVQVDHTSVHDRKKFWPLANGWCRSGVSVGQMRGAVDRARREAREPIAYLPAYVDRVLAQMATPAPAARAGRAEVSFSERQYGEGVMSL